MASSRRSQPAWSTAAPRVAEFWKSAVGGASGLVDGVRARLEKDDEDEEEEEEEEEEGEEEAGRVNWFCFSFFEFLIFSKYFRTAKY